MSRGSRGTRYGGAHERLRRRALATWVPGQACAICGEPTTKRGRLQLAHREGSDTEYLGLAHDTCNTGAAGQLTDYHGRPKPRDPDPTPWQGW